MEKNPLAQNDYASNPSEFFFSDIFGILESQNLHFQGITRELQMFCKSKCFRIIFRK